MITIINIDNNNDIILRAMKSIVDRVKLVYLINLRRKLGSM